LSEIQQRQGFGVGFRSTQPNLQFMGFLFLAGSGAKNSSTIGLTYLAIGKE
jgi:hypothetical protein